MTGEQVLNTLLEGNRRYLEGRKRGVHQVPDRQQLVAGQTPHAAILCCSDSRVPPEHIFDQTHGEMFVVRVAGNIAGPSEVGSLEYAVEHLEVPLVLVMGHEGCGAVKAALEGTKASGALGSVIDEIAPAVRPVLQQGDPAKDPISEAVRANVWYTMSQLLKRSDVVKGSVQKGDLLVSGAVYSLRTGVVQVLTEEE
jgi:carbonic anhydrase